MSRYTLSTTVNRPYETTLAAVRVRLEEQGFGILTEIDLCATLKTKLGVDLLPQVILGACRAPLAYEALKADPSIATLLPCNVVVRALDETTTVVEAFDPGTMAGLAGGDAVRLVARDARERLNTMLDSLNEEI